MTLHLGITQLTRLLPRGEDLHRDNLLICPPPLLFPPLTILSPSPPPPPHTHKTLSRKRGANLKRGQHP